VSVAKNQTRLEGQEGVLGEQSQAPKAKAKGVPKVKEALRYSRDADDTNDVPKPLDGEVPKEQGPKQDQANEPTAEGDEITQRAETLEKAAEEKSKEEPNLLSRLWGKVTDNWKAVAGIATTAVCGGILAMPGDSEEDRSHETVGSGLSLGQVAAGAAGLAALGGAAYRYSKSENASESSDAPASRSTRKSNKRKSKSKKSAKSESESSGLMIILCVAAVLLLVSLLIFYFKGGNAKKMEFDLEAQEMREA